MDPLNLKKLNAARNERKAAMLISELGLGRDRLIVEGDLVAGALGEEVSKAFRSGKSSTVVLGEEEFFLNVHVPSPKIVVIGAVHISQALVSIAKVSGYEIEIIDPRTAFASTDRFPDVRLTADWPQEVLPQGALDPYCAMVAVTHDPKIDDYPLIEALKANCFYVGALGSRKTHAKRVERFKEAGLTTTQIDQIHAPIGLDIGASSPQEIAVAIMAEIIETFRKRETNLSGSAIESSKS